MSGIVRDARDRVLFVQSRDDGSWTTPGGAIELTDTPADAVVREVWEEAGVLGGSLLAHGDDGDEIQAAKFLSYDEARELQLSPWLAPVLPHVYERAAPWFEPPTWTPA